MSKPIQSIRFSAGKLISGKYEIKSHLGGGWEGDVYLVREKKTGIERAAKFFLPQRNRKNRTATFYAKKLHKLRNCSILIQYLTQETLEYQGHKITYLVSEYVDGVPLGEFLKRQKGKRLHPFQALHLLHALAKGMEEIHLMREYHGDLHIDNVIVQRHGLGFDLKVIDMFQYGKAKPQNIHDDVCDLIRIFYDAIGGKRYYAKTHKVVREICCGLKRSLILKKYKTAGQLRVYLENLNWS